MRDGLSARDRGDWTGAEKGFRAAFALVPTPNTGNELAQALLKLGRLVEAREVAFAVVKMPAREGEPAEHTSGRVACADMASQLDDRIPTVSVRVDGLPRNAEFTLTLDGEALNNSALDAPRAVDPGEHSLTFRALGYPDQSRAFQLAVSERREETFKVDPIAVAPIATVAKVPAPPAAAEAPRAPSRALAWTGFTVGGVGLAAGAAAGAYVLSQTASFRSTCANGHCPVDQHDALASANTAATISNIAFALGGAGIVVGSISLLLTRSSDPPQARTTPYFGLGSAGVSGAFE